MRPWLISMGIILAVMVAAYLSLTFLLPFVLPFVLALVLTEMLEPVVRLGERWPGAPRGVVVGLTLLLLLGAFFGLLTWGVAALLGELRALNEQLPALIAQGEAILEGLLLSVTNVRANLPEGVQTLIKEPIASLMQSMKHWVPEMQTGLKAIASVPAFLVDLLVAVVATFFISRDRKQLGRFVAVLVPAPWRHHLGQMHRDLIISAWRYVRAQIILVSITMILTMIGLFVIGAPYVLVISLITGIADLLPVIGPTVILVPWGIYSLVAGNTAFGAALLVLYALLAIIRQVAEPRVVGDSLGLHPVAVLAALYLGYQVFGPIGILFGPLIAMLLKVVVSTGVVPIFAAQEAGDKTG